MATIAICDGNDLDRGIIEKVIYEFSADKGIPISVIPFKTGEELLRNEIFKQYDIYVIEVCLPGKNGFDIAKELRRRSDRGQIIFLSRTRDFAVESYFVNAHFYLLKPLNVETFFDVLAAAIRKIATKTKYSFKTENDTVVVNPREILYVNVENRSPVLHLTRDRQEIGVKLRVSLQATMKGLFSLGDFTMLGPSNIVNLEYVSRIGRKTVTLSSGNCIDAAESATHSFMLEYHEYLEHRAHMHTGGIE